MTPDMEVARRVDAVLAEAATAGLELDVRNRSDLARLAPYRIGWHDALDAVAEYVRALEPGPVYLGTMLSALRSQVKR